MQNETKKFFSLSNGTFTLSETPIKNHFYFYRNDGRPLGDLNSHTPFEFYQAYVIRKIISGEITDTVDHKISCDKSVDDICLRLIVSNNSDNFEDSSSKVSCAKFSKIFKRLRKNSLVKE